MDHFEFKTFSVGTDPVAYDGVDGECQDGAIGDDLIAARDVLKLPDIAGESLEGIWGVGGASFEDPLFG